MSLTLILSLIQMLPTIIRDAKLVIDFFHKEETTTAIEAIKAVIPSALPIIEEIAGHIFKKGSLAQGKEVLAKIMTGIQINQEENIFWEQQTGKLFDTMHDFPRPTGEN